MSFYSIFIYLITIFLGIHKVELKKDILIFIPIISKRYWFITIYFVLCIISPILNLIINNIDKHQFKRILIVMLLLFYLIPTFQYMVNAPTITGDSGYGIVNFVCLYFYGRYIKLYYCDNGNIALYVIGYILSSILLFLGNHILSKIFGFYFNSFISYDTIFLLISAITLFLIFKNITIESKLINNLSKYALVAFLIHMHPTFFDYLFHNILKINEFHGLGYLFIILIYPPIIYLISWFIEYMRMSIFNSLENKIIDKFFENIKIFGTDSVKIV